MGDVVQTIRAFVQDHILEPDALRGSEHVLRELDVKDEEQARRDAQAEALTSKAPIRLTSGATQTAALDIAPSMVDNAAAEQWARDNGWKAPDHSAVVDARRESNETRTPDRLVADAPDRTRYSADASPVDRDRPEYSSGNLTPNTPNPPPTTPPPPAEPHI